MGQFLTDKYLKARAALQRRLIDGDFPCAQCSYNLRGLRYGGSCPECGAPIRYKRDLGVAFTEMPIGMIRAYRAGAWLAAAASLGGILVWWSGNFVLPPWPRLAVASVLAAAWVVAVWQLTTATDLPPAIALASWRRSRLRLAARWLQAGWLVALSAHAAATGAPGNPWGAVAVAGLLAGLAGVVALMVFLGRLADRVGAELASKSFDLAVFGSVSAGLVLLVMWPLIGSGRGSTMWPLYLFVIVFVVFPVALMFAASVLALPAGLGLLGHTLGWSAVHSRERLDRDRRLRERMAARPEPQPEPPEIVSLAEAPREGPPGQPVPGPPASGTMSAL